MTIAMHLNIIFRCLGLISLAMIAACNMHQSKSEEKENNCNPAEGWLNYKSFAFPIHADYVPLFIGKDTYKINRLSVDRDEYVSYINRLADRKNRTKDSPIFILLYSESEISCEHFLRESKILDEVYQCGSEKLCIWGYGAGTNARPLGVPSPPPRN